MLEQVLAVNAILNNIALANTSIKLDAVRQHQACQWVNGRSLCSSLFCALCSSALFTLLRSSLFFAPTPDEIWRCEQRKHQMEGMDAHRYRCKRPNQAESATCNWGGEGRFWKVQLPSPCRWITAKILAVTFKTSHQHCIMSHVKWRGIPW